MGFPVVKKMTSAKFKSDIIDHYWGTNLQDLINASKDLPDHPVATKASELVEDYCKIGAFLSDADKVLAALQPLEAKLRVAGAQAAAVADAIKTTNRNDPARLKAHKLLTKVLGDSEIVTGFNNPKLFYPDGTAKLHSEAHAAERDADNKVVLDGGLPKAVKADFSKKAPLPTGPGTAMGNVTGRDFNRILLRHGYQFKDVGAGIDHGEFTHRLHWFAIDNANLGLSNPLNYIYRTLGSLFASGKTNTNGGTVYLWEALFDCFPSAEVAKAQKSIAWAENGCFNCPDFLNMRLTSRSALKQMSYVEGDTANLWFLRVLLISRDIKRRAEIENAIGPQEKLAAKTVGNPPKKILQESYISPKKDDNERAGLDGRLIWYLNN